MTATIPDTCGTGDSAADAPVHCGDPMILRETSYRGAGYGIIGQVHAGSDVELVWACPCGFQLSHAEPADLALPLSPSLRRVAAATADLESCQWRFDQVSDRLETAVRRAAAAGMPVPRIAEAAQLDPAAVRDLLPIPALIPTRDFAGSAELLSHVG